jgi:hypothetical protein
MAALDNYYEVTIDTFQVLTWEKSIILSHLLLKLIVMAFRVLKTEDNFRLSYDTDKCNKKFKIHQNLKDLE